MNIIARLAAFLLLTIASLSAVAEPVDLVAQRDNKTWEIRTGETPLSVALTRWANEAGWTDLKWSAEKELPGYPMQFTGTFEEAIIRVMADTQVTAYPMRACGYLNKVVRIIQSASNCKR